MACHEIGEGGGLHAGVLRRREGLTTRGTACS